MLSKPIMWTRTSGKVWRLLLLAAMGNVLPVQASGTDGPNLIQNPSLEIASPGSPTMPQAWLHGGWGTNTANFIYPAFPAAEGSTAVRIDMTSYTSGDAKWYFNEVAVTPSRTYRFTDHYLATVPSVVSIRYRLTNGSFTYQTIATPGEAQSYASLSVSFVVPANATGLTVFHLIRQVGALTVDNYELHEALPSPPIPGNLIDNPSLETADTNNGSLPQSWVRQSWGVNNALFTYPVSGLADQRAAKVQISSYSSGDAKWVFAEVPVTAGTIYSFSDTYQADVGTKIVVQCRQASGGYTFLTLGEVPPSDVPQNFTKSFTMPANVTKATVFHLLRSLGSLTVDNYALVEAHPFTQGMVSLNFDDGFKTTMQNVVPVLSAAGFKMTQYIITHRFDVPEYVNAEDVLSMHAQGHEIGSHTRTHPDLTTLTPAQLESEVNGSRQDLLAIGVTSVSTFAYPYGTCDTNAVQAVRAGGYAGARCSYDGANLSTDDHFVLKRYNMGNTVTFDQVMNWIDGAIVRKEWVILVFHRVDRNNNQYAVTPELFQQVVDYLAVRQVPIVTTSQGLHLMNP